MNLNETLTMAAFMLAPAFFSLLGMGALGSSAIAVLAELTAKTKGRVFYDKYGQQTASMGLILLIILLVVYGATIGIALIKFPQFLQRIIAPTSPFSSAFIAFGVFAIMSLLYFPTWKKMRDIKGMHIVIGMGSAISALACVAIAIPAKLMIGSTVNSPQPGSLTSTPQIAWPMAAMFVILIMSVAAALSCSYLVARREKDDFGRDYYNFAIRLATRWAAIPMAGFLACQGWLFAILPESIKTMTLGTPLGIVWAVSIALGITCISIWALIARSSNPLQLKGLSFLAIILLWIMHTMNATLFINFMSMQ